MVMAKSYRKKIGFVSLWRDSKGKWKARFLDPTTGRDVRRTLQVSSEAEAIEAIKVLNRAVIEERGLIPSSKSRPSDGLTVVEALVESIRSTRGSCETRRRYLQGANNFLAFLRARYLKVQYWVDVRPSMLAEWLKTMQAKGLAYDTIRLALVPIRRAATYWAAERPELYQDVAKAAGSRLIIEKRPPGPQPVLDAGQMAELLDWLKAEVPHLFPLACLSGLAGLRMFEAAYVRHCDVDWSASTVSIAETDLHRPKNLASHRKIPVIGAVLTGITSYLELVKVRPVDDRVPIFCHTRGSAWSNNGIINAWQRTMRMARRELEIDVLADFKPRRLRACFATLAREAKADARVLKVYLGHTPEDVLGRHYEALTVESMRREIAEPVARIWGAARQDGWQNPGSTKMEAE